MASAVNLLGEATGEEGGMETAPEDVVHRQSTSDSREIIEMYKRVTDVMTELHNYRDIIPPEAQLHVQELEQSLGRIGRTFPLERVHPLVSGVKPKVFAVKHENTQSDDTSEDETRSKRRQKTNPKQKVRRTASSSSSGTSSPREKAKPSSRSSRKSGGRTPRNGDTSAYMDQMIEALSRLDSRTVPKPEPYTVESGLPITDFLVLFEEYCGSNFRGSKSLWISELGRLLTGSIHEAFLALKVPGESYRTLKEKLVRWCEASKENLTHDIRRKFEKAKMQPEESYRLYAARLEGIFRLAYPNRDPTNSGTLRRKYMQSVTKSFRKQLATARSLMVMQGKELNWQELIVLAGRQDVEYEGTDSDTGGEPQAVWVAATPEHANPRRNLPFRPSVQDPGPRSLNRVRSDQEDSRDSLTCHHCKIKGHIRADCMRYNKLCFVCGAKSHLMSQCPQRESFFSRSGSSSAGSRNQPQGGARRRVSFDLDGHNSRDGPASPNPPLNYQAPVYRGASHRS